MSPEVRTGLRRIMGVLAGAGQAAIVYSLRLFEGWQRTALYLLVLALTATFLHVAMEEGRERERLGRR
jgi:uncharacterized membrane protein YgaE (UPF0421/DUF939 family)